MRVVITGGAGFLGLRLAKKLLEQGVLTGPKGRPEAIGQIVLIDMVRAEGIPDPRVVQFIGDIADDNLIDRALDAKAVSVFHLAAVVSGQAEAEFDLGMRINVDATRRWLEACRAHAGTPRFVFTSSVAVFGGVLPEKVPESTALNPQSSYGTQKAIGELLVNDYSRRGFIDGRTLRLPTISVRPGKPNRAASSFLSGIIREPLSGVESVCPVRAETRVWLQSPRKVIENLIRGHEVPASALGLNRSLNLPGLTVTVADMVADLERMSGTEVARRIRWEYDPTIDQIISSWPGELDAGRAERLGFQRDRDFASVIQAFIDDDLRPA